MAMVETTIIPFAQVTLNNCGQASKKGANMKTQYGARQSPFGVIPGSTAGRLSLGSSLHCTGGILNGGIIRVGKCHGYDRYIRVKKLGSWGKMFGRPK